jgi:hypothetical protein
MQNEEVKPEMKVLVDYEGSAKPAKVIGPVERRIGTSVRIIAWVVAMEPNNLHVQVTADKMSPTRLD